MWRWLMALAVTGVLPATAAEWDIPFGMMSVTNQALVRSVTERWTLQREYGPRRFPGRRAYFAYLLDHMHACSTLAEQAGLITYRARLLPDGRLYADNREDAAGYLLQVGCTEDSRIYYVEGTQKGVFMVHGRGVVTVRFRQVSPSEIEYSGQLFVRVDNPVAATLAKVFFVFVRETVDRNYDYVMRQPVFLTHLAAGKPHLFRELLQQLRPADYPLLVPLEQRLETPPQ